MARVGVLNSELAPSRLFSCSLLLSNAPSCLITELVVFDMTAALPVEDSCDCHLKESVVESEH